MIFEQSNQLDLAIAKTLRKKCEENGWVMNQLAKKLGVSHSFIGKVETGERILSIGELDSYCFGLDTSLETVISKIKLQR